MTRFASFRVGTRATWGVVNDHGVIDLSLRYKEWPTLRSALGSSRFPHGLDLAGDADFSWDDILWDPVITDPKKIFCIGLNYESHRLEVGRPATQYPTVFTRYPDSQIGNEGEVLLPTESDHLDYEGELATIIGRTCRRIKPEEAYSVVAGYACYNDVSVRDYQHHGTQWAAGKNWPATGAFGPWMVTSDEIPDPSILKIETVLNGKVVQSGCLDDLIFSIPDLIAYCSTWSELNPGDVIVTGTPGGVGMAYKPPRWMKDGDVVEVTVDGLGKLTNRIKREPQLSQTLLSGDN